MTTSGANCHAACVHLSVSHSLFPFLLPLLPQCNLPSLLMLDFQGSRVGGKRSARSRRGCAEHRALRGPPSLCELWPSLSPAGLQPAVPGLNHDSPRHPAHIQPVAQTAECSLGHHPRQQDRQTFREGRERWQGQHHLQLEEGAPEYRWAAPQGLSGDLPSSGPILSLLLTCMHMPRLWHQGS